MRFENPILISDSALTWIYDRIDASMCVQFNPVIDGVSRPRNVSEIEILEFSFVELL